MLHPCTAPSTPLPPLQVSVAYVPFLDSCSAWQLDRESLQPAYDTLVWSGPAAELAAAGAVGAGLQVRPGVALRVRLSRCQAAILRATRRFARQQEVQLVVRDVSEPRALALPGYRGQLYVYLAIAMGGVFLITAVPLLAALVVIYVGGGGEVLPPVLPPVLPAPAAHRGACVLRSAAGRVHTPQVNVRRNQGLPTIFFRYMRQYRGW
jgi:hypothetical protein